jgi:capsular exopolysaccharide synthesis family protein
MGKTYEALEWAEKEYQEQRREASREFVAVGPPAERTSTQPILVGYEDLKTNLLTRYADGSVKTVLFAGTAHRDGASTAAINFAATLARDSKLKVLLIDANLKTPRLHEVFKIDNVHGLADLVAEDGRRVFSLGAERGNLRIVPSGGADFDPMTLFDSSWFEMFLKKVRDGYDYVILDAPPVHGSPECRVLCAKVDGVVLVIEAGKTRRQVALSAKKQLEEAGGKILGVVLNKRKFYIPEFIYRRL